MSNANEPAHEPVLEKVFGGLFGGPGHTRRDEEVREYIAYRLGHGAHLEEVLQEGYVRRHCPQKEIDAIIRDPRLIHESRASLWRLFESGELDPTPSPHPRRDPR